MANKYAMILFTFFTSLLIAKSVEDEHQEKLNVCPEANKECKSKCDVEGTQCYLIERHGYIVSSENNEDVGRFFCQIDPVLMKQMMRQGETCFIQCKS